MKYLFISFTIAGILSSCNSSESAKSNAIETETTATATEAVLTENSVQFKAIDSDEALIATALMAAPEASRANCKVIGYNIAGEFVTFKEGSNELIVIADNPKQKGFNAACYHKDLEPFMARGRELKAEGKSGQEIFDIREEEMKSGKLSITPGATLHIYYGPDELYATASAKVQHANYRYVVYMPWSTSESTGLPEVPLASNHPWIMNPGTHRAHIMITPLADESH